MVDSPEDPGADPDTLPLPHQALRATVQLSLGFPSVSWVPTSNGKQPGKSQQTGHAGNLHSVWRPRAAYRMALLASLPVPLVGGQRRGQGHRLGFEPRPDINGAFIH